MAAKAINDALEGIQYVDGTQRRNLTNNRGTIECCPPPTQPENARKDY